MLVLAERREWVLYCEGERTKGLTSSKEIGCV